MSLVEILWLGLDYWRNCGVDFNYSVDRVDKKRVDFLAKIVIEYSAERVSLLFNLTELPRAARSSPFASIVEIPCTLFDIVNIVRDVTNKLASKCRKLGFEKWALLIVKELLDRTRLQLVGKIVQSRYSITVYPR